MHFHTSPRNKFLKTLVVFKDSKEDVKMAPRFTACFAVLLGNRLFVAVGLLLALASPSLASSSLADAAADGEKRKLLRSQTYRNAAPSDLRLDTKQDLADNHQTQTKDIGGHRRTEMAKGNNMDLFGDTYIGCYIDSTPGTAMEHQTSMYHSIDSCRIYCLGQHYEFAGLREGQDCYCGDTYSNYGAAYSDEECNISCSHGGGGTCGGAGKLSVFETKDPDHVLVEETTTKVLDEVHDLFGASALEGPPSSPTASSIAPPLPTVAFTPMPTPLSTMDATELGTIDATDLSTIDATDEETTFDSLDVTGSPTAAPTDASVLGQVTNYVGLFFSGTTPAPMPAPTTLVLTAAIPETISPTLASTTLGTLDATESSTFASTEAATEATDSILSGSAVGTAAPTEETLLGQVQQIFDPTVSLGGALTGSEAEEAEKGLYMGCYVDKPHAHAMEFKSHSFHNIATCRHFCREHMYNYAGLEAGSHCYCGNTYDSHGRAEKDTECDMTCARTPLGGGGMCGSTDRLSVFASNRIIATAAPSSSPTIGNTYRGCFLDDPEDPAMEHESEDKYGIDGCREYCRDMEFDYAGLQNSTKCFCGNTYDSHGHAESDMTCDIPCAEGGGICGGSDKLSVFSTKEEGDSS